MSLQTGSITGSSMRMMKMNDDVSIPEDMMERYEERRTTETIIKRDPVLEQIAQELHQININLEKIARRIQMPEVI